MRALAHHRRWVGWLCGAAILWMGLAAQQHLLSHAIEAVHGSGKAPAAAEHALTCAQCLQFAGLDAALAAPPPPLARLGPPAFDPPAVGARRDAETFVAYASRAPPAV